jgi:hypothetical protein
LRRRLAFGTKALVSTWASLPRGHRILLAANLAFCVAGLVLTQLPSWRMFEAIPDPRHVITDAAGKRIRGEDYLPRDAYLFRPVTLAKIAIFACERGDATPPITIETGDRRFHVERRDDRCVSPELPDASR